MRALRMRLPWVTIRTTLGLGLVLRGEDPIIKALKMSGFINQGTAFGFGVLFWGRLTSWFRV